VLRERQQERVQLGLRASGELRCQRSSLPHVLGLDSRALECSCSAASGTAGALDTAATAGLLRQQHRFNMQQQQQPHKKRAMLLFKRIVLGALSAGFNCKQWAAELGICVYRHSALQVDQQHVASFVQAFCQCAAAQSPKCSDYVCHVYTGW
jgi:hypothetical protein